MKEIKLRVYDGIALTGFLTLPAVFSTAIAQLVERNNTAVWIALLLSAALMLCLFLILMPLMRRYRGKNIVEIASAVMGRPVGIIYGTALTAYFCFFSGVHIRESAEILKIYGMSLTPVYVVAGSIILTAAVMNLLGGKAIIKSAGFFFILILIGIVFIALLGLNHYNPDNLAPVLGNGAHDIALGGLLAVSIFDCVILLYLFAPAFADAGRLKKSGVISIALTAGVYILLCLCCIMMFSPSVASKMMSGFIEMGRSSYYDHFFYKFESLLLFPVIFSSAMLASIGLYASGLGLTYALKLKPSKTAALICAVPVAAITLAPANILELTGQYIPIIRRYSVCFMAGFPLLLLIIHTIKRVLRHEKI